MKAKRIIGKLLMAFVLVSVGFAIGKEVQKGRATSTAGPAGPPPAGEGDRVVVYYLHATFRCMTCNLVESMSEQLVRTEFADAVQAGKVRWQAVNYQENDEIADRYNVSGNLIVVARFRDGKQVATRRLDRVMELANSRDEFMAYVRAAVRELLEGGA